jgi:quercetin dioxygenase-like cupin family protein
MKKLTLTVSLILAGALAYALVAQAQSGAKADAVKVDPKHYKVEFENEKVRVLRIAYAPGEKSVMHYHPDSVAIYLTDGKARMQTPDGKSQDSPAKAGATAFAPAGSHLPSNVGDKPFEVLLVELKK